MSTIADKIETLYSIKSDIKNAIIEKGVQANDDFTTYADDIDQISGGSVNPLEDNANWQAWNYKANNNTISSATTFNETYQNTTYIFCFMRRRLTSSSGDFKYMFYCSNRSPKIQFIYLDVVGDYMASASNMCGNQTQLVVSEIKYDWFTDTRYMYYGCTALKFVCTDEVKATNCELMFNGCKNLLEVPTSFPNATSVYQIFSSCASLQNLSVSVPVATNCQSMFSGCTSLTNMNQSLPSVTNCGGLFMHCTSLVTAQIDIGETRVGVEIAAGLLVGYCTALKSLNIIMNKDCSSGIKLADYYLKGGTSSTFVDNCSSLVRITGINIAIERGLNSSNYFINSSTVRYFLVYNLGYSGYHYNLSTNLPNWGIEDVNEPYSIGAAQSLKDSLITYSYDRKSAGKSSLTLTLTTAQKALLTDSEIAQITAKGYTIA